MIMRKFLLFAIAISLGSIAFAGTWDPQPLDQATCDFFGYPAWAPNGNTRSVKGCLTCPVYENGHRVTCESVAAANNGVINKDCCWLNTPKNQNLDPILGNCYTNGCVLGPNPWSVKCVCLLNCAMSDPNQTCYSQCNNLPHPSPNPSNNPSCLSVGQNGGNGGVNAPNGGNGNNGNIGHNNGNGNKIHKKITAPRPTAPKVKPSRPARAPVTAAKSNATAKKSEDTKSVAK
jgi:hypothetical protein